jgi:hypothetical protein
MNTVIKAVGRTGGIAIASILKQARQAKLSCAEAGK